MKRYNLNRKRDQRIFRKTARRTKAININQKTSRGGVRL